MAFCCHFNYQLSLSSQTWGFVCILRVHFRGPYGEARFCTDLSRLWWPLLWWYLEEHTMKPWKEGVSIDGELLDLRPLGLSKTDVSVFVAVEFPDELLEPILRWYREFKLIRHSELKCWSRKRLSSRQRTECSSSLSRRSKTQFQRPWSIKGHRLAFGTPDRWSSALNVPRLTMKCKDAPRETPPAWTFKDWNMRAMPAVMKKRQTLIPQSQDKLQRERSASKQNKQPDNTMEHPAQTDRQDDFHLVPSKGFKSFSRWLERQGSARWQWCKRSPAHSITRRWLSGSNTLVQKGQQNNNSAERKSVTGG